MKWSLFILIAAILLIVFLFAFRHFRRSIQTNDSSTHLTRGRFYWGKQKHLPDDLLRDKEQNT